MLRRGAFSLAALLVLSSCASPHASHAPLFLSRYGLENPSPENFAFCHGHGCRKKEALSFSPGEWESLGEAFSPPAQNAEEERKQISRAIGWAETLTGKKTGTDVDKAGTMASIGSPGQLDCVDEALNATSFLMMFGKSGWMRFHQVRGPVTRGFFVGGWPHTAAGMAERKNNNFYVVDSWFFDNGRPASIVPRSLWRSGWEPAKKLR